MKRTHKKVIVIGLASLIGIISIIIIYCIDTSYKIIKEGITFDEARRIVDNNDAFYIVASQHGATGAQYEIVYGINKGFDIELSGNTPMKKLSNIFFLHYPNSFLVKSTGLFFNTDNFGKSFEKAYPNIFTVEVEYWEILIPIKRDYQYRKVGQKERIFNPQKYIDQFDIDNGDYRP